MALIRRFALPNSCVSLPISSENSLRVRGLFHIIQEPCGQIDAAPSFSLHLVGQNVAVYQNPRQYLNDCRSGGSPSRKFGWILRLAGLYLSVTHAGLHSLFQTSLCFRYITSYLNQLSNIIVIYSSWDCLYELRHWELYTPIWRTNSLLRQWTNPTPLATYSRRPAVRKRTTSCSSLLLSIISISKGWWASTLGEVPYPNKQHHKDPCPCSMTWV